MRFTLRSSVHAILVVASAFGASSCRSTSERSTSERAAEPVESVWSGVVDAGCARCRFAAAEEGCDLAIRVDGRTWLVDGTGIDDHGDAHADDGFCNATRRARVSGRFVGDRFVAETFDLLPDAPAR